MYGFGFDFEKEGEKNYFDIYAIHGLYLHERVMILNTYLPKKLNFSSQENFIMTEPILTKMFVVKKEFLYIIAM